MKKKARKRPARRSDNEKPPLIQAALLCEKVLREEAVPTLVRVVDTFTVSGPTPDMPPGVVAFTVYVAFKSGEAIGRRMLSLTGRTPSGRKVPIAPESEMEFNGEEHGAALIVNAHVAVNEPGVYWIDVRVNKRMMTRIPFRIRYRLVETDRPPKPPKRK